MWANPLAIRVVAFHCRTGFSREGVDMSVDRLLRRLQHDPTATDVGQLALKRFDLLGPQGD